MHKSIIVTVIFLSMLSLPALAYGPFDYTNPEHFRNKLPVVEQYHFNSDVENLIRGMDGKSLADDLSYVLRTFPNHHRALLAMSRYWEQYRRKGEVPPRMDPEKNPEYWFERAISFAPHDGVARMLFGIYLHKKGDLDQALEYYQQAEKIIPEAYLSELHYNMGLLFVNKNQFQKALIHARKAYALGYPLPGLRNQLQAAGVWMQGAEQH